MKVEGSYSFVHNRLIFFIYCKGENKKEKRHENAIYEFMKNQIDILQSDLDNSFFMLEYDRDLMKIIEEIIKVAFDFTQKQFQEIPMTLEIKRIIGSA